MLLSQEVLLGIYRHAEIKKIYPEAMAFCGD
jgi:hypothetical protein